MDWTKAKTIIIMALIVTNLFLICTYVMDRREKSREELSVEQETIALLKTKNVTLEAEIPELRGRMPVLDVRYDTLDEGVLQEAIEAQTPLPRKKRSLESIKNMSESFLRHLGVWDEFVALDQAKEEEGRTVLTYKNVMSNGIPLEDSYMICTVENGRVASLERYWLKPIDYRRGKKEIITPTAALIDFVAEKQGEEKISITELEMVYWLDSSAIDTESPLTDTAVPAWKIVYNGGQVYHVPAYEE